MRSRGRRVDATCSATSRTREIRHRLRPQPIRRASDLLLAAAICAMPTHRHPFRMVNDPLCDVRLRGHGTLIERYLRRKLKMLILAMIGSRQSAYRQHDLDETHWAVSISNQSHR